MDTLYPQGVALVQWLQQTYPNIEQIMVGVSSLGNFEFYLLLLTLLYWSVDKQIGRTLSLLIILNGAVNGILKALIQGARPFWFDEALALGETASYGAPSGHMQLATIFIFFLAMKLNHTAVWVLAFIYAFLMGFSRVYLGLHFVQDVVAGAAVATFFLFAYVYWSQVGSKQFAYPMLGQRLLAAMVIPVSLFVVYVLATQLVGTPDLTNQVIRTAEYETQDQIAQSLGLLLGASLGFVFEMNRVWMLTSGSLWQRLVRWIIGFAGAIVIWQGVKLLLGEDNVHDVRPLAFGLRALRYTLLGAWIAFYAPQLFIWMRLAYRAPESESSITFRDAHYRSPQPKQRKKWFTWLD